jgi:hypothetical protein
MSPYAFKREKGKIRKTEIRNTTIKNGKRTKKREQRERYTTQKENDYRVP